MRFLVQPNAENLARARPPVRAFLAFAALALAALTVQRATAGLLQAEGVVAYYLPDGEPLPVVALWEELHAGAFLYGMVLLMAGSLLAVCPVRGRLRGSLFTAAFAATLGDLGAPFAVVRAPALGWLRVAAFCAVVATLSALLLLVALTYGRAGRRADA